MFFSLLSAGVSPNKAPDTLYDILTSARLVPAEPGAKSRFMRQWPARSTVQNMNVERGMLAEMDACEKLLAQPDGGAALGTDEATKCGGSRFAIGFCANVDGPGSNIFDCALGVEAMAGGTAEDERDAVLRLLGSLAKHYNLSRAAKHEELVTVEDLLVKFGATMSDSAATAKKTNRLIFDIIAEASSKRSGQTKEEASADLKQFFCWLHKGINLCKVLNWV